MVHITRRTEYYKNSGSKRLFLRNQETGALYKYVNYFCKLFSINYKKGGNEFKLFNDEKFIF